jgi:large subunit ribosomal protein L7/L12
MADETKENQEQEEQKTEDTQAENQTEETQAEETKEEEKTEDASNDDSASEGEEVEVPEKFKKIVEEIEQMPVLELNELVKVFEKKFGVSAAAVAAPAAGGDGGEAEAAEEKSSFDVELSDAGEQKIQVIKIVKEILGLGLKEAKDTAENAPSVLKEGAGKEEAEDIKAKIEEAGGKVELK